MPVYRFQCEACGLNFSTRVAVGAEKTKCSCGSAAGRDLPRGFSTSTSVSSSAGGLDAPPASGYASHDYEVDRIVGQDSLTKWKQISLRQKDKLRVMHANNVTGFDLTRTHDGSYRPMSKDNREASERSRGFHFKMAAHIKKLKAEKAK